MPTEFALLGDVEARTDGRSVDIGHTRQQLVLVALILRANRAVCLEELVERVWMDRAPLRARQVIYTYLSRLRKALAGAEDVGISRRQGGYVLSVDPLRVDLLQFRLLVGEARTADDDAVKAARLDRALALWRGPAFAGFDMPWLNEVRTALDRERAATELDRNDLALHHGLHGQLLPDLSAAVAAHPLDERLGCQLMLALYRCGRQADALEHYRQIRLQLADELGIDPSPALQGLHQQMLAADGVLEAPAVIGTATFTIVSGDAQFPLTGVAARMPAASASAVSRSPIANVPARNAHFTGRDEMLGELHCRFQADTIGLTALALYGMGGVGKTQIAIEFAHRFAGDYHLMWWIDAQHAVLIPEQFISLASRLGLPACGPAADIVEQVLTELAREPGCLLIFDNAECPEDIVGYMPVKSVHVIVTSRFPGWGALGGRMEVDVLARAETVALLRARNPEMSVDLADCLADALGDLPLAAAQAAGYLEQTGMAPGDYLDRFRARQARLLASGDVLGYQGRVDTTWEISLDRLSRDNSVAVDVLEFGAFLAPEPIPLSLFTDHPEYLDATMRSIVAAADPDAMSDAVGAAVGFSLVRRHPDGFQLHRLVQAVIRHRLPPARRSRVAAQVVTLLAAARPGDPNNPAHWASYARLAPHVLAVGDLGDGHPQFRRFSIATVSYLNIRGANQASRLVTEQVLRRWQRKLGPDHPDTLRLACALAGSLLWLGKADEARAVGQDAFERARLVLGVNDCVTLFLAAVVALALAWLGRAATARGVSQDALHCARQILGPDHPISLILATSLVFALTWPGPDEQSPDLAREALDRSRRSLGSDHPMTLFSATNLAFALACHGETEESLAVGQDALQRSRQALGPDHLITLLSACNVTFTLICLGDYQQTRSLAQDTLERSCRLLGPDHQLTLVLATNLAVAHLNVGDLQQARSLGQDTLTRANCVLGPDHRITLTLQQFRTEIECDSGVTGHVLPDTIVQQRSPASNNQSARTEVLPYPI